MQRISVRNKKNRNNMETPHTTGSDPFAYYTYMNELNGIENTPLGIWQQFHTTKGSKFINEKTEKIYVKLLTLDFLVQIFNTPSYCYIDDFVQEEVKKLKEDALAEGVEDFDEIQGFLQVLRPAKAKKVKDGFKSSQGFLAATYGIAANEALVRENMELKGKVEDLSGEVKEMKEKLDFFLSTMGYPSANPQTAKGKLKVNEKDRDTNGDGAENDNEDEDEDTGNLNEEDLADMEFL